MGCKLLLKQAAKLLPASARVVLLANRGLCAVAWLRQAGELSGSWRIRLKSNVWVYRLGRPRLTVSRLRPPKAQAHFQHSEPDPEPACSSFRQFFVSGPSLRVPFDP